MLRSNKGVTMISIIVTVLIMAALAGISVGLGLSSVDKIRIGRMVASMTMVKAKAEIVYENYQFSEIENNLVGSKTNLDSDGIILSDNEKNMIEGEDEYWYKWDADVLENQGLDPKMLSGNEVYYVNYENTEVISSKGAKFADEKCYSITGLKYLLEKIEE